MKLINFLFNRRMRFNYLNALGITRVYNDEEYIKRKFLLDLGEELNLSNPKTYNEKLQWLKLYDKNPFYSVMADKYLVKKYIDALLGEGYTVPTLGVWESFDDIDFRKLPNKFVLKTTHDSKGVVMCDDKENFNIFAVKKFLNKHLRKNFYYHNRELPYKYIVPRIMAEEYLDDGNLKIHNSICDYKVMCFEGIARLIQVHQGRFSNEHYQDFYTPEWNRTNIKQEVLESNPIPYQKPLNLDRMIELSQIISKGLHHLRVDWYIVNDKLYVGELTFYDSAGFDKFSKKEDDLLLGSWIHLPTDEGV